MVEHPAVNRRVASSSLARGAKKALKYFRVFMFYMTYYAYILKSQMIDKYYIGSSENPERRLQFHNTIERGFTSRYRPWEIVFKQEFESKNLAIAAERKLKKWRSKKMTERVIKGEIKL